MSTIDNLKSETDDTSTQGNRYALVVGVNNTRASSYLPDLRYAEDDAHAVYHTLRQPACNFAFLTSIPVLTGEKAETRDVRRAVIKLAQKKADHNFLLFYFIGHAQPMKTKEGRDDIYFVTHDFNEDEVKEDSTAHLSMRWLREMLYRPDGAGSVLLILDCCYAGNVIHSGPDPFHIDLRKLVQECLDGPHIVQQSGRLRVMLTATGYNTPAQERVMTSMILSALQGKVRSAVDEGGNVNIHTLYTYLQDRMPGAQLPNLSGDFPRSCVLAAYPEQSSAMLQQAKQAEEGERWSKLIQVLEQLSAASSVITDPHYFQLLSMTQTRSLLLPFDQGTDGAASFADLDPEKVADFFKRNRVQIQDDFDGGASDQEQLKHFSLLHESHPTHGAILCFSSNPTKWIPGAFTRCTLWSGPDRDPGWLEAQDYRRDLITQFEAGRQFLRKHLRLIRVIGRNERAEEPEIPLVALEEALANALVHREYAHQTSPVYVDIFTDRIEICSPGVPPEPMTLELLEEEHKSHPRNPQIARIFYLYGYVEKVGSGIRRMQRALEGAGLQPARFELGKDNVFKAVFYRSRPEEYLAVQEGQPSAPGFGQGDQTQRREKPEPMWNVPAALVPLIGREQEMTAILTILTRPEVRLLTLTGAGGIGKTSLALHISAALRDEFRDGIIFVSLDSVLNVRQFLPTVAQALGLALTEDRPVVDLLKASLSSKRVLLVLDSFEHLLSASSQVEELLDACPSLKIMITSRVGVRIHSEHMVYVPPLALPDITHLPDSESLSQYGAVDLFIQCARRALPSFQLTSTNASAVAEICVRLDGLPLAIELAAARIRLLPPQAMLENLLNSSLQLLTSGTRDMPVRQQTLRNTLDWSYNLLAAKEQQLFRALSVFVSGFTLEALEAVSYTGDEQTAEVLNTLTSLIDNSLLYQTEREGEDQRFMMSEIVREYGLMRLHESGEAEENRRRHATYYLARVEEAETNLKGAQQIVWLTSLEREWGNLQAALEWLIEHEETEQTLRFCGALWWFWRLRDYWSEGQRWLNTALELKQIGTPTVARAKALCGAGDLAYCQGDYTKARILLEECITLCRMLDIKKELIIALITSGMLLHMQGDSVAAHGLLQEGESLCRTPASDWELSYLLHELAQISIDEGDLQRATEYSKEGLALARSLGDRFLIATILNILGNIVSLRDDLIQATQYTQDMLSSARELGHKLLTALALQKLAYYKALQGDLTLGRHAQEALTLVRGLSDKVYITTTLYILGYIALRQDNLEQAAVCHSEGLSLALEIGNEKQIGQHLIGLARVAATKGRTEQAARLFGAASARLDVNASMNSSERAEYEHDVIKVRAQLGDSAFKILWNEGYALIPEQALARSQPDLSPEANPNTKANPRPEYPEGLTSREVEILRLVAHGFTDAQIAERLVISPRTVNTHITSIYRKIGATSRSSATRYAIERKLI